MKCGFKNINRKDYAVVNLSDLDRFDEGTEVTPELLIESGIIKKQLAGVKLLAGGEVTKKLSVKVAKYSAAAKEAVEAAGGSIEVI